MTILTCEQAVGQKRWVHCHWCGTVVEKRKAGPLRKWCDDSCRLASHRFNNPEYVARQKRLAQARIEASRPPRPRCVSCGDELRVIREKAKFCGKSECRHAFYLERKKSAPTCSIKNCDSHVMAKGLCGPHYSRAWGKKNPDRIRLMKERRRARKYEAFVEDVDRMAVFNRDRWVCHICGGKIAKSAVFPDPSSPSVDHLIPLAQGGEHRMANVAAAHLGCNNAKGQYGGGEQLMLIG